MQNPGEFFLGIEAVLTIAEIKTAVELFEEGDTNAFTALAAIITAVESHQAKVQPRQKAA